MAVNFNHTIVWARDSAASATFLAEILGLPLPKQWGPFLVVTTDNGTNLDFMNADGEIAPQHYAFLVSEAEFDEVFGRVRERSLPYWADPVQKQAGEINHHDGGRGFSLRIPMVTSSRSSPVLTAAAAESVTSTVVGPVLPGPWVISGRWSRRQRDVRPPHESGHAPSRPEMSAWCHKRTSRRKGKLTRPCSRR